MGPVGFLITHMFVVLVVGSVGLVAQPYPSSTQTENSTLVDNSTASMVTQTNSSETGSQLVVMDPPLLTVQDGDEISLSCQVSGTLPLNITWFHDGVEIDSPSIRIKTKKLGSSLTISSASASYAGVYECRVVEVNTSDVFSATSNVTVQGPDGHLFTCSGEMKSFCENGGLCMYLRGNTVDLICACPREYVGKRCQYRDIDIFEFSLAGSDMMVPLFGVAIGILLVAVIIASAVAYKYKSESRNLPKGPQNDNL